MLPFPLASNQFYLIKAEKFWVYFKFQVSVNHRYTNAYLHRFSLFIWNQNVVVCLYCVIKTVIFLAYTGTNSIKIEVNHNTNWCISRAFIGVNGSSWNKFISYIKSIPFKLNVNWFASHCIDVAFLMFSNCQIQTRKICGCQDAATAMQGGMALMEKSLCWPAKHPDF